MVAMIGGVDNGSFFVPFGVLTFWRPFARFLFYQKQYPDALYRPCPDLDRLLYLFPVLEDMFPITRPRIVFEVHDCDIADVLQEILYCLENG